MKYTILMVVFLSSTAFAEVRVGDTIVYKQHRFENGMKVSEQVMKNIVTEILSNGDFQFDMQQLSPYQPYSTSVTIPAVNSNYIDSQNKVWMADCERLGGIASIIVIDGKSVKTCKETLRDHATGNPTLEIYHADLPKNNWAKSISYDEGKISSIETLESFEFGN